MNPNLYLIGLNILQVYIVVKNVLSYLYFWERQICKIEGNIKSQIVPLTPPNVPTISNSCFVVHS